ncbi:hypothetical protein FDH82_gp43 [Roseobacter phage RDJL Phi 2]|uniref:Uncharacterized protein n=1 Tax=Roseobacter phage RDJL Phi 2 TaxID=1682380 RepID=A0A0K0PWQ0_9CAUD|nr:hypothetical protein FDH82_gp43 [Roseobacter phage RDJL Phi 2]AKQ75833.1 hypothetical protein RDJLphi2_gp43 [Roseobacter phage RDJL Phi 2]
MSPRNYVELSIFKRAADRCDGYLTRYGLEVTWSLTPIGMKLVACFGADKFERFVGWDEIAQANFDILERTEQAALAGLSS